MNVIPSTNNIQKKIASYYLRETTIVHFKLMYNIQKKIARILVAGGSLGLQAPTYNIQKKIARSSGRSSGSKEGRSNNIQKKIASLLPVSPPLRTATDDPQHSKENSKLLGRGLAYRIPLQQEQHSKENSKHEVARVLTGSSGFACGQHSKENSKSPKRNFGR